MWLCPINLTNKSDVRYVPMGKGLMPTPWVLPSDGGCIRSERLVLQQPGYLIDDSTPIL
jgi:hypothetical protein